MYGVEYSDMKLELCIHSKILGLKKRGIYCFPYYVYVHNNAWDGTSENTSLWHFIWCGALAVIVEILFY